MGRRGWWLILLSMFVPGLPQVIAGDRRLGRRGLRTTVLIWVVVAAALAITVVQPAFFAGIFTNPFVLYALPVLFVALLVFWGYYLVNTVQLVQLRHTSTGTRTALLGLIIVGLIASIGVTAQASSMAINAASAVAKVFGQTRIADPVNGRYNILLLGGDSGKGRWSLRTDSMTVVSVDATTGKSVMIGIPRNLLNVPFPDGSVMKSLFPNGYNCGPTCMMNSLYVRGMAERKSFPAADKNGGRNAGIQATIDGASGVTGLKIQYYVLVNMKGFKQVIDALGGVTINVAERLPKTTGHGTKGYIEAGKQKMDGATALWYARIRHNPGGSDYQRMQRQRQLQRAILQQINPQTVVTKFNDLAQASTATLETDIPSAQLQGFVDLANKARKQTPIDVELVRPKVNSENPDYPAIHDMVNAAVAKASAKKSN